MLTMPGFLLRPLRIHFSVESGIPVLYDSAYKVSREPVPFEKLPDTFHSRLTYLHLMTSNLSYESSLYEKLEKAGR